MRMCASAVQAFSSGTRIFLLTKDGFPLTYIFMAAYGRFDCINSDIKLLI